MFQFYSKIEKDQQHIPNTRYNFIPQFYVTFVSPFREILKESTIKGPTEKEEKKAENEEKKGRRKAKRKVKRREDKMN